jgi:hypothetical protein
MKREHIYIVAFVLVALLIIGGIYQFYFRGLLEQYGQSVARRDQLRQRLTELAGPEEFGGYRPASLVSAWRGHIQPWTDALESRASYYRLEEVKVDPVPEGKIPKFHYAEEFEKRVLELQQYAFTRNPPCQIPADLFGYFGAPTPESIAGRSVTAQQVVDWLRQFDTGARLLRLFIDAGAETIQDFQIWPVRSDYDDMLEMHPVGVRITIRMEKLVAFLESLQRADRYFSVGALSIQNANLISWYDPTLQVSMFVTQAQLPVDVVEAAAAVAGGGVSEGAVSVQSMEDQMREMRRAWVAKQKKPSWWSEFRRQWLPF